MTNEQATGRLQSFLNIFEGYHSSEIDRNQETIIHQLVTNSLANANGRCVSQENLGQVKRSVELIIHTVWDSNRVAWLSIGSTDPEQILKQHGTEVLEIAGTTSDLETRKLLERATKDELVLALSVLDSNGSIGTLINIDESSDPFWQTALIVGVLTLALAAAVWFFWRRSSHSKDFRIIAEYQTFQWARLLCEYGPSHRTFRIPAAWRSVELCEEDKREAIPALAGLEGYFELVPTAGSQFDESEMCLSGSDEVRFVYSCLRPGLRFGDEVLEKALVDAGSSDYVAMKLLSDNQITPVFLEVSETCGRIHPAFRISPGALQNLYLRNVSDSEMQAWLALLVEACPASDLSQVNVSSGDVYNEKLMLNDGEEVADRANAYVAIVFHKGLLRDGKVLLRAKVLAKEPEDRNPYGDI